MSYQAIICKLENIQSHSNASRLNIATAAGVQVIVSLEAKNGDIGVFFGDDGVLSPKMCYENNLYNKKELNKDPTKRGFFNKNARISAQNFRGERSYGLWIELSSLAWTGIDLTTLKSGFTFTSLNNKEVCHKYINPATIRIAEQEEKSNNNKLSKVKRKYSQLKEHVGTKQFQREIKNIPRGSILYITSKLHGTSARTGNVLVKKGLTRKQQLWNKYFYWIKKYKPTEEYKLVSGSRRTIVNTDEQKYHGKTFRIDIHNRLQKLEIPKGITIFYEIVGFDETSKNIMPTQPIKKITDKKLRKLMEKKYGNTMTYSYGCKKFDPDPEKRYRIFIYRATTTNVNGIIHELAWPQVRGLCATLTLETVPSTRDPYFFEDDSREGREALAKELEQFLDIEESLDTNHITEGVVIRVETPDGRTYFLKQKGWIFKLLEGACHSIPGAIDIEELENLR
jgi:hypothetical protein